MVAAVYVVGGPGDREELRHSLRSLVNAPSIDEAWVVGDVPEWFAGVKMPLPPHPEKYANQRASLSAFVNYPGAPERFYLFNDDFFVIEPTAEALPVCRDAKPASTWLGDNPLSSWRRAVTQTATWASEQIGADSLIYECHTPLLFDTARLREAINAYPPDRHFAAGEMYALAGAGDIGEVCGNAKCRADDTLADKLALPMPYLSSNPDSWEGELGRLIRRMFPVPYIYEKPALEAAA